MYPLVDSLRTQVDQAWTRLGQEGPEWGRKVKMLLEPFPDRLMLTVNDAFYRLSQGAVHRPLLPGTPIYAQADSPSANTTYGAVLPSREMTCGAYDHILQEFVSTSSFANGGRPPKPILQEYPELSPPRLWWYCNPHVAANSQGNQAWPSHCSPHRAASSQGSEDASWGYYASQTDCLKPGPHPSRRLVGGGN
jgi:hypothetical protein